MLIRGTKGSRKVTLTEQGMILRKRAEEIWDLVRKTENITVTYNLLFNAFLFVKEVLGYAISFDKIIHTSDNSHLFFHPLPLKMEIEMSIIWKNIKYFLSLLKNFSKC